MAKSRNIKRSRKANPADAKATGRFFLITGITVGVILLILFLIFNSL